MWTNFYAAGGWGMYPTSLFGFLLLATGLLFALRPDRRFFGVLVCLGVLTASSGALGCAMGMVRTFHYLPEVAPAEQLIIAAAGCAESLHNLILAMLLVIVASLVTLVGAVRALRSAPPLQGAA